MNERFIVLPRDQADGRHSPTHDATGLEGARILQDRRRRERRQQAGPYEPERRRSDRRHPGPGGEGVHARPLGAQPLHPHIEIVRHADGPVEIKLSGLVGALERRARRWQAVVLLLLLGLVVGASAAVAVFALRWDYQRGRTVALLQNDLELAQARARCWEALARYAPKSPGDVIPEPNKSEWVRQCVAVELARLNPKQ